MPPKDNGKVYSYLAMLEDPNIGPTYSLTNANIAWEAAGDVVAKWLWLNTEILK